MVIVARKSSLSYSFWALLLSQGMRAPPSGLLTLFNWDFWIFLFCSGFFFFFNLHAYFSLCVLVSISLPGSALTFSFPPFLLLSCFPPYPSPHLLLFLFSLSLLLPIKSTSSIISSLAAFHKHPFHHHPQHNPFILLWYHNTVTLPLLRHISYCMLRFAFIPGPTAS